MDRNDIQCQVCGKYIFNGLQYWCVEYAGECKFAESDSTKAHALTYMSRRDNGYMLCPTCMKKHENKCPVCDKLLTVKRAWMHSIPIMLNDELTTITFTLIPNESSFGSPTRFNMTIGEVKTNHIINFSDTDEHVYNNINAAILLIFGDCKWYIY